MVPNGLRTGQDLTRLQVDVTHHSAQEPSQLGAIKSGKMVNDMSDVQLRCEDRRLQRALDISTSFPGFTGLFYMEKDVPQPQDEVAFGFSITNRAPISSWV